MNIILSRKGFDSKAGGQASPIMPDGTLLSMPIPDDGDDSAPTFHELRWDDIPYDEILAKLSPPKKVDFSAQKCHLDPDIRQAARAEIPSGWVPAFGQCQQAQSYLSARSIAPGDLFLFFGWFHRAHWDTGEGAYKYTSKEESTDFYDSSDLHMIYGYMQVGKIITDQSEISRYSWHPHASSGHRKLPHNTLYIPTEKLSLAPELPGCGTLDYRQDRVLTLSNHTKATWVDHPFLRPDNLVRTNRKNSCSGEGIYYAGQWQELMFDATDDMKQWVKTILSK